jgi:AbrB family transcriptional regulator (stage V sporulation protein T)
MKATGIIRRIDDLGRVVIPKEIRRILRIKEGDPLEVFIHDGCVMYKKYSPIGELGEFAQEYADSLFEATGYVTLISDKENIIAVAGISKRDFLNKPIWNLALKVIEERKVLKGFIEEDQEEFDYQTQIVAPIILENDVIGVIGLIAKNDIVGITEQKLIETAAMFLAKQMEV